MSKFDPTSFSRPDRRTPLIVFGIWAGMVAMAATLIAVYGQNVPYADEWESMPELTRHRPTDLAWFISRHNEHRILIPRLIFLGLFRLTKDLRTAMYFNVAMLGLTSLLLIFAATKLRGRLRVSDALFPLFLLSLGNWENIVWGWQIQYSMSVSLVLLFVVYMALGGPPQRPGSTLAAGACLLMLPLCGANGSLCALVLACWLFLAGAWLLFRNRGVGLLAMILALMALAMVAACWLKPGRLALVRIPEFWPWVGLENLAQYFSVSFAPPFVTTENAAPTRILTIWPLWTLLGTVLVLASLLRWRKLSADDRVQALGFLALCAAIVGMQVATSFLRPIPYGVRLFGGGTITTFVCRYALVFAPLPLALYFFWERYGGPRGRALVQTTLFCLGLLSLLYIGPAFQGVRARAQVLRAFVAEAQSDEPAAVVAQRQSPHVLVPGAQDRLTGFIEQWREYWPH